MKSVWTGEWPTPKAKPVKYIPSHRLPELNYIAAKHRKNSLVDDCPVLKEPYHVPISLALPGIDSTGWVRCLVPATPDCSVQVCLDVRQEDFDCLPLYPASADHKGGVEDVVVSET